MFTEASKNKGESILIKHMKRGHKNISCCYIRINQMYLFNSMKTILFPTVETLDSDSLIA